MDSIIIVISSAIFFFAGVAIGYTMRDNHQTTKDKYRTISDHNDTRLMAAQRFAEASRKFDADDDLAFN